MSTTKQNVDTEFEVAPTMHVSDSRDPLEQRPAIDDKKPIIEKHITEIPQEDDTKGVHQSSNIHDPSQNGAHKENLKDKLKKHLPGHHGSEVSAEHDNKTVDLEKHDSGTSEFEVAGFMPMTTSDSPDSASKRPNLERHISSIPENDNDVDGEEEKGMSGKLRRTISHIAQKD